MSRPLVSILVPCFNAGPMLRPALESVAAQTHPEIEILFVDNGSTDGSAEVAFAALDRGGRPFRIVHCAERGANAARNFGYPFVQGDYVQWMDADDLMDPDKIARQVAALEAAPDYDIAYGDWTERRIQPGYPRYEKRHALAQAKDQIHRTLCGLWYPPHSYLLRRAAADRLQALQAWRTDCKVGTDIEYSALAALAGMRFLYAPGAHVHYNIWSDRQISGATPYPERVSSLAAIFARLRAFAANPPAARLVTARHRMLLEQDWTIWSLPRQSVTLTRLPGRRARLTHRQTGREIEIRPRDALIVKAMHDSAKALAACHWGLLLAEVEPPVVDDPADVVEALQKLRREGFLTAVDDAAQARI